MIVKSPIIRAWLVHVGFHTGWVLLYLISLLGFFLLIPFTSLYNAFVLGFLGKPVLASATAAALLGYVVFSVTGLLSGWFIFRFRLKLVWLPEFLSLAMACVLLVGASLTRYSYLGAAGLETILPLPTTTGRADVDELSMALKSEYESAGEVPVYLNGNAAIIPLLELRPSLEILSKDFKLSGGPYVYCNLPAATWKALKKEVSNCKHPVLWSTQPDADGKHLVISVDLATDIFHDELVSGEDFHQRLSGFETAVSKTTGDTNFNLLK